MSNLPSWLHSHLNTRPPFQQTPGERVDAWNVATWTPGGLHIVAGAHDRSVAERLAGEYTDSETIPGTFTVIRGGTAAERGSQR